MWSDSRELKWLITKPGIWAVNCKYTDNISMLLNNVDSYKKKKKNFFQRWFSVKNLKNNQIYSNETTDQYISIHSWSNTMRPPRLQQA